MTVSHHGGVRVLIVEDHALFAESLELALSLERYDVRRLPNGQDPTSTSQLMVCAARWRPDIVLLDLDLGMLGDGTKLITPLARFGAKVVVITASADQARGGECLLAGARQVLLKTRPLTEALSTVRRLSLGQAVLSYQGREELIRIYHEKRSEQQHLRRRLELLTKRERQVLGHLMAGQPVREIARISVVSEATVRTQVKSIMAKLNVSSQLTAVWVAHQAGWLPPDAGWLPPGSGS